MRKRYQNNVILIVVVTFLVGGMIGCSTQGPDDEPVVRLINVKFEYEPDVIQPRQGVTLKATVYQGEEPVNDALDIQFEIAREEGESQFVKGELSDDGQYTGAFVFHEEGLYHVFTHVTARDMHAMPHEVIPVGDFSEEEIQQAKQNKPKSKLDHGYIELDPNQDVHHDHDAHQNHDQKDTDEEAQGGTSFQTTYW